MAQDTARAWDGESFFVRGVDHDGQETLCFDFDKEPVGDVGSYAEVFGALRDDLMGTLRRDAGAAETTRHKNIMPIAMISRHYDSIVSELRDLCESQGERAIEALNATIQPYRVAQKERIADSVKRGVIEFEDLGLLFEDGDEIITVFDNEPIAGIYRGGALEFTFMGPIYSFRYEVIHHLGSGLQSTEAKSSMRPYVGLRKIDTLPLRKITEVEKAKLTGRGERYRDLVLGRCYVQYSGQVVRSHWMGPKSYRSDGRAMIDAASMRQVDSDQWNNEGYSAPCEVQGGRGSGVESFLNIDDSELWRTYPFVHGFSFASKQWGRFTVDAISKIEFRDDAWEKLVLEPEKKELVKALVEHSGQGSFEDLIDGKGGGVIFLLDGPPGQGKTLTAETVAETLHRPLYSISVGELGTNPDVLEQRLRQILDVAMSWDAVLLLDEADIFLEARNKDDIVRNAMVGVFLRLLEYHQGVLFLTTNRVENLDEAFLSRISVSIHFTPATVAKREQVWTNLLAAAKLDNTPAGAAARVEEYAVHNLNGRQIKTVIRLAQTLARARGLDVTPVLIEEVIKVSRPLKDHGMGMRSLEEAA